VTDQKHQWYADHLVHDVLSWWLTNGPDDEHGGVLTCWDNAGKSLVSTDKYTWSQGRWIWLMVRVAAAARRGVLAPGTVDPEDCLRRARATATFVREHALLDDGTTAYVTDRAGNPREPSPGSGLHTSAFADCFVALGLAALAQVDGDAEAGRLAESLLLRVAARARKRAVRTDPYPVHPGFRPLSVPMILVGTGTEVWAATGSGRCADVVVAAAGELATTLRTGSHLVEMRPDDPGLADTLLARHRTPGHVLEVLWFLVNAADTVPGVAAVLAAGGTAASDGGLPDWLPDAALHALEIGWDAAHGGLFRYVDAGGGQPRGRLLDDPYERLVGDTWDTKLWWPHAEALYATALLARRGRGHLLAAWHERVRGYTLGTFPGGPGEEWVQIRARDGTPLDRVVALPVKDPFHVARALLLLAELEAGDVGHQERNPA
jgi:N-acylglucosamine 2-epimerase